jgi:hypothetical protein
MSSTIKTHHHGPHDQLLQYTSTVHAMHNSLHRIFTNAKAVSESLTRTAAALRKISSASTAGKITASID